MNTHAHVQAHTHIHKHKHMHTTHALTTHKCTPKIFTHMSTHEHTYVCLFKPTYYTSMTGIVIHMAKSIAAYRNALANACRTWPQLVLCIIFNMLFIIWALTVDFIRILNWQGPPCGTSSVMYIWEHETNNRAAAYLLDGLRASASTMVWPIALPAELITDEGRQDE